MAQGHGNSSKSPSKAAHRRLRAGLGADSRVGHGGHAAGVQMAGVSLDICFLRHIRQFFVIAQAVSPNCSAGRHGNGASGCVGRTGTQSKEPGPGNGALTEWLLSGGCCTSACSMALGQTGRHHIHSGGHRRMLQKVQGEQEKQSKPSYREITATSKGNEMLGQQPPCLAQCLSLPSCWNGVVQSCSFLELWLLRDVSHCQHGVEFNAYLYFYGVAVAQQPIQILWLKCACSDEPAACTVRGSVCPAGFRSMVRSSVLGAPLLLFIYRAHTREE